MLWDFAILIVIYSLLNISLCQPSAFQILLDHNSHQLQPTQWLGLTRVVVHQHLEATRLVKADLHL